MQISKLTSKTWSTFSGFGERAGDNTPTHVKPATTRQHPYTVPTNNRTMNTTGKDINASPTRIDTDHTQKHLILRFTRKTKQFVAFGLLLLAGALTTPVSAQTTTTVDICSRTAQVQTAILAAIPATNDCTAVTSTQLAAITGTLSLNFMNIGSLQSGDFAGLTSLTRLNLDGNTITTIDANTFSGLTSLTRLDLNNNRLTTIDANTFSGLTSLTRLDSNNNNTLTTIDVNAFSGLTSLTQLELRGSAVTTIDANTFSGLTSLTRLDLSSTNVLTAVPAGVFDGLGSLRQLFLNANALTALPENLFSDLTRLNTLWLHNNTFTTALPANILNPVPSGAQIRIDLSPIGDLPDVALPVGGTATINVANAFISRGFGGARTINYTAMPANTAVATAIETSGMVAISSVGTGAGATTVSVTADDGESGAKGMFTRDVAVTVVETGILAFDEATGNAIATPVAAENSGTDTFYVQLASAPASDVTLTLTSSDANEGTVSPPTLTFTAADGATSWNMRQAVTVTAVDDNSDRDDTFMVNFAVTTGDTGNYPTSLVIPSVTVNITDDDTAASICSRTMQVQTVILARIPGSPACADVIESQLAAITGILDLNRMSIGSLQAGDFAGLSGLTSLNLTINSLSTLPAGVFDELTSLTSLNLSFNSLSALPAGIFDNLTGLTSLELNTNALSALPMGVFDNLTSLTQLFLSNNSLTALPDDALFTGLTSLNFLRLQGNTFTTALPANIFAPVSGATIEIDLSPIGDLADIPSLTLGGVATINVANAFISRDAGGNDRTITYTITPTGTSVASATESSGVLTITASDTITGVTTINIVADDTVGMYTRNIAVTVDAPPAAAALALFEEADSTTGSTVVTSIITGEPDVAATFYVELTSAPTADVTVAVTSDDTSEGTVSPATLTFTTGDWNVRQLVTVTGANDDLVDGTQPYNVILNPASVSDTNYNALADSTVTATNTDDDSAALALFAEVDSATGSTVVTSIITGEPDVAATFYVELTSAPTADVTVAVTSDDTSEGTVSPATLTFTTGDWNVRQLVTVTGANDDLADGTQTYNVTLNPASVSDTNYNALADSTVTATNTDDDSAALALFEEVDSATGSTVVTSIITGEPDVAATFYVELTSAPTADVTVAVTSDDTSEGTVSPATLTFTTGDWNVRQLVTVTGANDDLVDGTQPYNVILNPASVSDTNYNALADSTVTATNTDDDSAALALFAEVDSATGSTIVTSIITGEPDVAATFYVELTSAPTADVTVAVTSDDTSEGTVSPATLTFTTGDWNVRQLVTVTGANDDLADGTQTYNVTLNPASVSDTNYNALADSTVTATNTDDDIPVNICDRTTMVETAILAAIPETNDCTAVTSTHLAAITGTLNLFNNRIQTLQVGDFAGLSGVTSLNLSGNFISAANALPADVFTGLTSLTELNLGNHNFLTALQVGVFNGLTSLEILNLNQLAALTTLPAGVFDNLTSLTNLNLRSGGLTTLPAGIFDSLTSLTRLQLEFNALTALPAGVFDNLTSLTRLQLENNDLTTLPAGIFDNLTNLTQLDLFVNDLTTLPAGLFDNLTSLTTLTLTANPFTTPLPTDIFDSLSSVDIRIDTSPIGDLPGVALTDGGATTINVTNAFISRFGTSNGSLNFSEMSNDATVATVTETSGVVTITSVGMGTTTVSVTADNGRGAAGSMHTRDIAVTVVATGILAFDGATGDTLATPVAAENGGTDTFYVQLASAPASDVTLTLTSSDANEGTVMPGTLTFTAAGGTAPWDTRQAVTVTAVPDDIDDDDTFTVDFEIATAADGDGVNYTDSLTLPSVTVLVTDDDSAGLALFEESDSTMGSTQVTAITTSEPDTPTTFYVQLTSQPTATVTVTVTSTDLTEGTITTGASLVFSSTTWDTPRQAVTVTGVDDSDADVDTGYSVILASASSDTNYNALADTTVTATNTDDDAVNICDRTPEVESAILNAISTMSPPACDVVPVTQLVAITGSLNLSSMSISALLPGDFADLSGLTSLFLDGNDLSTLPAGIFNPLTALTSLDLSFNSLTMLPSGIFSTLTNLTALVLWDNSSLGTLESDVFSALTNLTRLDLQNTGLSALPAGLFTTLTRLTELRLHDNAFTTPLPANLFDPVSSAVITIDLSPIGDLADIVLTFGTTTMINVADAFISRDLLGNDRNLSFTITPTGTSVTSATESSGVVTITASNTITGTTDVDITAGDGTGMYTRDIAVTVEAAVDICSRPDQVRIVILAAISPSPTCSNVTATQLAAITDLNFAGRLFTTVLSSGDFAGLSGLTTLDLSFNGLTTLPADLFSGLTSLSTLRLQGNAFDAATPLASNLFDPLPDGALIEIDLSPIGDLADISSLIVGTTTTINVAEAFISRDATGADRLLSFTITRTGTSVSSATESGGVVTITASNTITGMTDISVVADDDGGGANADFTRTVAVTVADVTVDICSRTDEVETAILAAIPADPACDAVTASQLAAITGTLRSRGISTLQSDDFAGLSALTTLDLLNNAISTLPAGVFDDLTSLTTLILGSNTLTALESNAFSALTSLTTLNLRSNSLRTLPADVFDDLTSLTSLDLSLNSLLTALPENLFSGLGSLSTLRLQDNTFTTPLPANLFDPLPNGAVIEIDLSPIGDLAVALGTNGMDTIDVSEGFISKDDMGEDRTLSYSAIMSDDTSVATVTSTGSMVTVTAAGNGATTVSITADDDSGGARADVTRTISVTVEAGMSICDRTTEVQTAILAAIPASPACDAVTAAQLSAITALNLGGMSITTLQAGDFADLSGVTLLFLSFNFLGTLPTGIFSGLTNLELLLLDDNNLSALEPDVFSGLGSLTALTLSRNSLSTLPANLFDNLTNLTALELSGNMLSALNANVFSALMSLTNLDLFDNELTTLPANLFDNLTSLTELTLEGNPFTTPLPADIFDLVSGANISIDLSPIGDLPDVALTVGGTTTINVANAFFSRNSDSDERPQTYTATPANMAVATATESNGVVTIAGAGMGATTVSVTADDRRGGTVGMRTRDIAVTVVATGILAFDEATGDTLATPVAAENGGTDTFYVQLASQPATGNSVTISVTSSDANEGTVLPATLTFTAAAGATSWDTRQLVTVTAVDDNIDRDDSFMVDFAIANAADGDGGNYTTSLDLSSVAVTVTDDDTAGIALFDAATGTDAPSITTTEGGGPDSFYVALESEPTGTVTVTISGLVAGEHTSAPPTTLTFTPTGTTVWSTRQEITLTGVDDDVVDGDQMYDLTLTPAGGGYDSVMAETVSVTNTDDDTAELTIADLTIDENAGTATLTVTLTPAVTAGDVMVNATTANGTAEAGADYTAITGQTLTFTAGSTSETLDITISDDTIAEGNETFTVMLGTLVQPTGVTTVSIAAADTATVTITDDETAPTTITLSVNPSTIPETAGATEITVTATIDGTVVLSTPTVVTVSVGGGTATGGGTDYTAVPDFDLTIPALSSSGMATFMIDPNTSSDNGDTVMITGTAPSFTTVNPATLTIVEAGILVYDAMSAGTEISTTTIDEASGTDMLYVQLASQPATGNSVTISVTSSDANEGTVLPATLTFTAAAGATSWDTRQLVTVTAVDDNIDRDDSFMVDFAIANAADGDGGNYTTSLDLSSVAVTVTDDDTAGIALFDAATGTDAPSITTTEGGGPDSFYVALESEPTGTVTVTISGLVAGEHTSAPPTTLTFTPTGTTVWSTRQEITLTGVDDDVVDGDQMYDLTLTPAGGGYDSVMAETVSVTNTDDDTAELTIADLTIDENAGTATLTVTLTPAVTAGDVMVNATTANGTAEAGADYTAITGQTLTFTAGSTSETLDITISDDTIAEGNETFTVMLGTLVQPTGVTTVSIAAADTATVTITDDETAPTTITLSVNPSTIPETAGATEITVTATIDGTVVLSTPTVVTVSVGGGTATGGGTDYTAVPDFDLTIPALSSSGMATFMIDPNTSSDNGDTVMITGTAPSFTTVNPATLTIVEAGILVYDAMSAGTEISTTTIAEASGTDMLYVQLASQPATGNSVTISVTSSDANEGTVLPATLTFTAAAGATSWDTRQLVTVTAVDDNIDRDDSFMVDFAIANAADGDGGNYTTSLDLSSVAVTVTDDDTAGIALFDAATGTDAPSITTTEGGGPDSFYVALESEPTGTVTVTISGLVAGEHTSAPPTTLTFTPTGTTVWSTRQEITLTGVDDDVVDGDQMYDLTLTPAGGGYDSVMAETVSVTNTDDDTAELTIADLTIDENAGTATLTVTLTPAVTAGDVMVNATTANGTAEAGADYTAITGQTLTFTAGSTSETLDITISDDTIAEGNETFTVMLGTLVQPTGVTTVSIAAADTATVTITDDETAPTTITLSVNPSTIPETAGATEITVTATIDGTVVLSTPTVVTVSVGGGTATGGGTDYTAVPDFDLTIPALSSSGMATFMIDPNTSSDNGDTVMITGTAPSFTTVNPATLTIVEAGILVYDAMSAGTEISTTTIDEASGTDMLYVQLASQPATGNSVTISVTSSDANEGTVLPATLTFTAAAGATSWDTRQLVTVTAVDDNIDRDGDSFMVDFAVTGGDGGNYTTSLDLSSVAVTVTDDDTAGIALFDATTGNTTVTTITTGEPDTATTFYVELTSQPTANVTVAVASDTTGEGQVTTGASLTFTTGNWNMRQAVTVTGQDDNDVDGDQTYAVTLSSTSTDTAYNALSDTTVTATNTDTDTAALSIADMSVNEDAGTVTLTVTLTPAVTATGNVLVDLTTADGTATGADYTAITSQTLTFTAGSTSETLSITINDDSIAEGNEAFTVMLNNLVQPTGVTTVSITDATAEVTIIDDDVPGLRVDIGNGVTTTEGSTASDTFSVVLNTQPTADVTVTISGIDATEHTFTTPASSILTFTTTNWSTAQTVTLNSVDDDFVDGDQTYDLTLTPTGGGYDRVVAQTVSVTNEDDTDTAVLTIADIMVDEDAGTATLTVTLTPAVTAGDVMVNAMTVDGTAEAGTDYTNTSQTLTFTAGSTTQTLDITINDDTIAEGNENFTVMLDTLVQPTGVTTVSITDATATVTITDDDTVSNTINLSVSPSTIAETADATTITVTATLGDGSVSLLTDTVVTLTISGTATINTDYTLTMPISTIAIAALSTSGTKTFMIDPEGDSNLEGEETVEITGTATINAMTATVTTATLTITEFSEEDQQAIEQTVAAQASGVTQVVTEQIGIRLVSRASTSSGSGGSTQDRQSLSSIDWQDDLAKFTYEGLKRLDSEADMSLDWLLRAAGGNGQLVMPLGAESLTLWATGGRISTKGDGVSDYEGDVNSFILGIDTALANDWLAGIAISYNDSEVDYTMDGTPEAETEQTLYGIHPYLSRTVSKGLTLWGTVGYGFGDVDFSRTGNGQATSDITQWMAAGGLEQQIITNTPWQGALRIKGLWGNAEVDATEYSGGIPIAKVDTDFWRARMESEMGYNFSLPGGNVRPYAIIGGRWDHNDAIVSGDEWHVDVGGGVELSDNAFALNISVRTQVTDGDTEEDSIFATGSVTYDLEQDGRGLQIALSRPLNNTSPAWDSHSFSALTDTASGLSAAPLTSELAYGWTVHPFGLKGALQTYVQNSFDNDDRHYAVGLELAVNALTLSFETGYHDHTSLNSGETDNTGLESLFKTKIRW